MIFARGLIVAAVGALAACGPGQANAAVPASDASPPAQCWTPEALAGTPKELKSTRSGPRLDLEALKQEPLPTPVPIAEDLRGSIRSVELPPGQKLIALTFDLCESDGDHAGYDGRVVDLLRAEGVKATFFAGGKWLESHPERAQQLIADPNFEIGAHGFRHRDLTHATDKTMAEEISLPEAAFVRARRALQARACATDLGTAANAPQELPRSALP